MEKEALGLPQNEIHMLDFPLHILSDIMLKLPPYSIIRCACVCTTFRNIVTDPSFKHLYFSRAPTTCVLLSDHHRLSTLHSSPPQTSPSSASSCLARIHSSASSLSGIDPILPHPKNPTPDTSRFISFQGHMKLVNSSHGLLCMRSQYPLYIVCNPLFGEILSLPPPPTTSNQFVRFSAFGFDPLTNRYKLIQIVPRHDQVVAELYQLGDDTWRTIENVPSPRPDSAFDPSLNGALHWVTDATRVSELICSFDLHTEKFKSVPPPSHFNAEYANHVFGTCVGVFKGRLCLCYVSEGARFETWLMEEYGVEASWTRGFAIDIQSYCGLRLHDKHRPIGFSSCGDMWLKADSDSDPHSECLVSYTADKGVFRHIDIGGIASNNVEAVPHVFSLVSLRNLVDVNNPHLTFQIIRPKKRPCYAPLDLTIGINHYYV
ncbi:F-box/kelch-repeat protein At3g06240-like [Abrus precatorius]|uniref:F-box/kelch-repeat protein At3g06240-like n=1 Tax=Abrus precatorius TaxID=3816 RepID=A0A8B8JDH4_ABRPR|nr:F-box/kelch-repeat protein At3g06240-like [Abrus precatorius]